jgi:D-serine dehydratase
MVDVLDASRRWERFAPLLRIMFPSLESAEGRIDSPLRPARTETSAGILGGRSGEVLIKCDHDLPITGCIKVRGGVYEMLCYAEQIATLHSLIRPDDKYDHLACAGVRYLFSRHAIVVGSTGMYLCSRTVGDKC